MSKVELTGKFKWVRPDSFKEWVKPDGTVDRKWSMVLYPDEASKETVMELQGRGLKNRLKKDEDGWNISFSRPVERTIKGRLTSLTPPVVYKEDGKTTLTDSVGNGSEGIVTLDVYEHFVGNTKNKSIAARWESVTVTKLVPYNITPVVEDTVEAIF